MPRTKIMLGCSLWILGTLVGVPFAAAEDYSNRIGVHVGMGAGKYTGGNLDHTDIGPLLTGGIRFGFTRNLDAVLGVRYGTFASTGLPDSIEVDAIGNTTNLGRTMHNQTTQIDASALYSFKPEARWSPLVFGGASVDFWKVEDLTGQSSSGMFANGSVPWGFKNDGYRTQLVGSNWSIHFGLGAEVELFRRIWLQATGRFDYLLAQNTDNTGASAAFHDPARVDANEFLSSISFGLHYFFTERDADSDGIANKVDPCPYEAEDKDGFQDLDGCPDTDNDKDGVPDASDKAVDQAEDKDNFQDDDGAPDPDNDADGILDASDRCPNDAEDKDNFQDDDGCPDDDNDGDGVSDAKDRCADTPKQVEVDTLGCPTAAKIESARVLGAVRFLPNTATLEPVSFTSLDSIAASLQAYPGVDVEIQGHTTDVGSNDKNLQLSQQRAEAVAAYLATKGIERRRLTPIGYGEESPLVKNATAANRARNERIVITPMETAPVEVPTQPEKRE